MIAADDKLLTIGNPRRDLRFTSVTQRQIDYENGQARIDPMARLWMVGALSESQGRLMFAASSKMAHRRRKKSVNV